jgi:4-amino-4-deoxy-L-arabinose transferase-like glycosyltransferase
MSVVNPSSHRLPWLALALVLVAVSAARIVLVASTGFNGLIGQDAYAYFGYAVDSLVVDGRLVFPPPPFPFPPGYPYLVALGVLVLGPAPWVGQLLSFSAGLVAAVLTAGLAQRARPGRPWLAVTAGSLVAVNGHLGRASISVMSDACALAAATASVLLVMEYRRTRRVPWLATAAAAAAAAILCRWAMGLVAVPVTVYAVAAVVRLPRGRALAHAATAAVVTLLVLSPIVVEFGSETPGFMVDFEAARWSPTHALQRTTVSTEGTQTFAAPPAVYYAVAPAHPSVLAPIMALFLLAGLWAAAGAIRSRSGPWREVALVVGWAAVVLVFLAGIALRNPRFTLTFLPPLAVLAALGVGRVGELMPSRRRVVATVAAFGVGWTAIGGWIYTVDLVRQKARHLQIVRWVEGLVEDDARLITFWYTATFGFESEIETIELFDLDLRTIRKTIEGRRPTYLLVNRSNIENQWRGRAPAAGYESLQRDPGLELIATHDGLSLFIVGPDPLHLGPTSPGTMTGIDTTSVGSARGSGRGGRPSAR